MLTLVNILILFFLFLILYQIFLASNIIEGLENQYQPYDTNNPNNALILAQKNAGNILYLKERLDSIQNDSTNQQLQDLSGNVQTLQTQVNGLVQAQQDYANQMTGGSAPQVTGTTSDDSTMNEQSSDYTSNLVTD
jgi:predicted PurR-regulated permease PerM